MPTNNEKKRVIKLKNKIVKACIECGFNLTIHDGKIGFEFEARAEGGSKKGSRSATPLRVLGKHPDDNEPVELFSGRYGPYIKHNGVNATVTAAFDPQTISLEEAIALLAAKEEGSGKRITKKTATKVAKKAAKAAVKKTAKKTAPKTSVKTTAKTTTKKTAKKTVKKTKK